MLRTDPPSNVGSDTRRSQATGASTGGDSGNVLGTWQEAFLWTVTSTSSVSLNVTPSLLTSAVISATPASQVVISLEESISETSASDLDHVTETPLTGAPEASKDLATTCASSLHRSSTDDAIERVSRTIESEGSVGGPPRHRKT